VKDTKIQIRVHTDIAPIAILNAHFLSFKMKNDKNINSTAKSKQIKIASQI
jgi:tRNA(Ser,Leu) C12 N-acetylase TAN1